MKGIVYDLSYADYDRIRAVRWTALKAMDVSPKHYRYMLTHPDKDTPAKAVGRATHTCLLEPEAFEREYVAWTGEGTRASKAYKEFAAVEGPYREILMPDEYAECLAMATALRRNPDTRPYTRYGRSEVTIVWRDKATGIRCKARIDRLSTKFVVNVKTAASIDARKFGRQAADLGYHGGLAFTYGGLAALGWPVETVALVVVDKSDEHDCGVFELSEDELFAGEKMVGRLLGKLATCRATRRYPGRFQGPQTLQLPGWAYGEDYEISSAEVL